MRLIATIQTFLITLITMFLCNSGVQGNTSVISPNTAQDDVNALSSFAKAGTSSYQSHYFFTTAKKYQQTYEPKIAIDFNFSVPVIFSSKLFLEKSAITVLKNHPRDQKIKSSLSPPVFLIS